MELQPERGRPGVRGLERLALLRARARRRFRGWLELDVQRRRQRGLGNESFFAHGLAETHSVTIPAGGSATTPALCIDPTQPTIRYFTAAADLAPAQLSVQLISTDVYGLTKTTQLGLQPVPGGWQLSHSFGLAQRRNSPSVQLRFSASGAAVRLDDVYIDPYIRA